MQTTLASDTPVRAARRVVWVTPCLVMPEGAVPPPGVVSAKPEQPPGPALAKAAPKPAEPDGFECFVSALVSAALAGGATRGAAILRSLLSEGRLNEAQVTEPLAATLRARGILSPFGYEASEAFRATAAAWRDVLRGVSGDLGGCGDTTLDNWASELVCAVAGAPQGRAGEYRRELRRRGVAAFGLLAA